MSFIAALEIFGSDVFHTFIEFLYAPIIFPEMLWILVPVILALFFMEMYFYWYPRSGIGHHKHLENTIFLLFISFDLIRYLFYTKADAIKIIIVIFAIQIFVLVGILDFRHKLPITGIFRLSSKQLIAVGSYLFIILVYSDLLYPVTLMHMCAVVVSVILLFLTMIGIRKTISYLEPKSYEELEHFLSQVENDVRKSMEDQPK